VVLAPRWATVRCPGQRQSRRDMYHLNTRNLHSTSRGSVCSKSTPHTRSRHPRPHTASSAAAPPQTEFSRLSTLFAVLSPSHRHNPCKLHQSLIMQKQPRPAGANSRRSPSRPHVTCPHPVSTLLGALQLNSIRRPQNGFPRPPKWHTAHPHAWHRVDERGAGSPAAQVPARERGHRSYGDVVSQAQTQFHVRG
jgi:hypothetical protein